MRTRLWVGALCNSSPKRRCQLHGAASLRDVDDTFMRSDSVFYDIDLNTARRSRQVVPSQPQRRAQTHYCRSAVRVPAWDPMLRLALLLLKLGAGAEEDAEPAAPKRLKIAELLNMARKAGADADAIDAAVRTAP